MSQSAVVERTSTSKFTSSDRKLAIVYRSIATLQPHANNARTHSRSQLRKLKASIEEFGFANPILIQSNGMIIAGHGRVEAAKLLGMNEVPTICLENLDQDQIRAYVIADNRLAELAGWASYRLSCNTCLRSISASTLRSPASKLRRLT